MTDISNLLAPPPEPEGASEAPETVQEAPEQAPVAQVESVKEPEPTADPQRQAYDDITDRLLARMAPVGTKANFKIMVYGPPGGTKSTFLNVPNNLIYDQEDGLISIKSWSQTSGEAIAPNLQSIPFVSFNQADILLDRLINRAPQLESFEVFSIDTMNDFYRKVLTEIVHREHAQRPNSLNKWVAETEHRVEANERVLDMVRKLRDMDRNLILTAHSKTVEPKGKPAKTYPDFSESMASKIEAMMDIVGYMEMEEVDGKSIPVMRVTTEGTIHAKSRVPLPPVIANPKYADLKAAWAKTTTFGG